MCFQKENSVHEKSPYPTIESPGCLFKEDTGSWSLALPTRPKPARGTTVPETRMERRTGEMDLRALGQLWRRSSS